MNLPRDFKQKRVVMIMLEINKWGQRVIIFKTIQMLQKNQNAKKENQ